MAAIMADFFLGMLERSIQSGILILVIMLIRKSVHKIPKKIICILWMLAALRLIVPVTIESSFSLMPDVGKWLEEENTVYAAVQQPETVGDMDGSIKGKELTGEAGEFSQYDSGSLDKGIASAYGQALYIEGRDIIGVRKAAGHKGLLIIAAVWAAGAEIMLLYGIYCYIRTGYIVKEAVIYRDNVKCCDRTDSAFVFGIIRPEIYIPFGLDEVQLGFILAHERAHIARRDHISKIVGFLILCFYWFNPLVWAAYILFCHDMEMACDERVVKDMNEQDKKGYSQTLLQRSIAQRPELASPLAFNGVSVKARIKNILDYKKPSMWVTVVSVIMCIVFGGCSLTSADSDGHGEEQGTEAVNYEEMVNQAESVNYEDMRKQAEIIYKNIELGLYETGEKVDYSFEEIISSMSNDEMAARLSLQSDSGNLLKLLIVSDLTYKYTLEITEPLMAAIGGHIYYNADGKTYDLGEVHTSGTGYPIAEGQDGIYVSGGHYIARLVVDEEKKALKIAEFAVVVFDEGGDEKYFSLRDGELAEEADNSYYEELIYRDVNVTDFWIGSNMASLKDKSGRSMWHFVNVDILGGTDEEYLSGAGYVDELLDVVNSVSFKHEGENSYTTESNRPYYDFAGGIFRVPNAEEHFIFKNGRLTDADFISGNSECIDNRGFLVDCQEQALIYEMEHERFTASELKVAEITGTPVPEDEVSARIWYAAYARENMPYGYVLFLNERFFTQEEMLDIAENITFTESAWY